jgi:hypothetical protein
MLALLLIPPFSVAAQKSSDQGGFALVSVEDGDPDNMTI